MKRLFRSLDRRGVRYLLISGQAAILYGAAHFSEDVDLWIDPTPSNAARLMHALGDCGARFHKSTPPMTRVQMRAGHGFHFVIPERPMDVFLDVMAVPPRVGPFGEAFQRASRIESAFGPVPLVSIEDLILLKQTRRHADYDVISALVRIRLARETRPSKRLLRWAARETFDPAARHRYLEALEIAEPVEECRSRIGARMSRLQAADTRYWARRIVALRRLRAAGQLMTEGVPVRLAMT